MSSKEQKKIFNGSVETDNGAEGADDGRRSPAPFLYTEDWQILLQVSMSIYPRLPSREASGLWFPCRLA